MFIAMLAMTIADPASKNMTTSYTPEANAIVVNNSISEIHKDNLLNVLSYSGKNYKIKGKLSGVATTYGAMFENRKTKSGDVFSHNRLSCAVPIGSSLFGKLLLITSHKTGKSVIVKANDVGNFGYDDGGNPNKYPTLGNDKAKRIVDLPQSAWVLLGVLDKNELDPKLNISLSDSIDVSVLESY